MSGNDNVGKHCYCATIHVIHSIVQYPCTMGSIKHAKYNNVEYHFCLWVLQCIWSHQLVHALGKW